ncbi:MAG: 2Fe-2S iron-sulfur cluster-binding protein [Hyphomonadaceae bacterium]|nr:2Fe-2S iron-sulfur cluster-binding protein [Hyphomonadaceae bacterium]
MSAYRLADGGAIDRDRVVRFTFNGRAMSGFSGDTLASALLGAGVMLVGRSFKRHRPRGVLSAGPEEPNALVGVGEGGRFEPNTQATQIRLYPDLIARSQNHWPSLGFDALAALDAASALFPAGFYYKTFKSPLRAWPLYERVIRALAGLGEPPKLPDPDSYGERFAHADVLVVGLGPAGLAAARAAAEAGLRVIAVEQDFRPGGALLAAATRINGAPSDLFVDQQASALREAGARVLTRTTAFGVYDHGLVGLVERLAEPGQTPSGAIAQRLWKVRAGRIILAAGAIERPLTFADNDRPGVMLAHAGAAYAQRYAVAAGRRVLFVASSDADYAALDALLRCGVSVCAVIDPREMAAIAPPARVIAARAGEHRTETTVIGALGGARVEGARVRRRGVDGTLDGDAMLVAGGWTPTIHLHAHMRGALAYDAARGVFLPQSETDTVRAVGACAGVASTAQCWRDGWRAGADAARALGRSAPDDPSPEIDAPLDEHDGFALPIPPRGADKQAFVDFQNDVTMADIALAAREGYRAVEHLKRYTTLGMGADQGKTSNLIGLHALAATREATPGSIGLTTYRPPFTPVTLSALAHDQTGANLEPTRRSPIFDDLVAAGAVMQTSGLWLRPRYFATHGETLHEAALHEARAVRTAVGVADASTLGKIEIAGPDAGALIDLAYATGVRTLQVGKARYAVMLNDDGFVYDDGTIWRLGAERYLATASTARTAGVLQRLTFLRDVVAPHYDVDVFDATEAWAALVVAGPRAADVLRATLGDVPPMAPQAVVETPALRIARISYSGEHAYELYCRPDAASALWRNLHAAARAAQGALYGLEALEWLRIEKGHVAVGAEIDGRTSATDLGLKAFIKKAPHAGARAAQRPAFTAEGRWRLVGLRSAYGADIPEGAPLVDDAGEQCGRVTSSGFGVGVGGAVALGLMRDGPAHHGAIVTAASATRRRHVRVRVGPSCAYDPEGARLA